MIRSIHLHGPIAEQLGYTEPLQFDADNLNELFSGLQMVFPDFRAVIREYKELSVVLKDGEDLKAIDAEKMQFNFGTEPEVHIAVAVDGSYEYIAAYLINAGWAAWAAYTVAIVATIAVGMAISSMLAPEMNSSSDSERAQNASHLFNGSETVVGQGYPVPLIYGRFKVGSAEISTELSSERQPIAMGETLALVPGTAGSVNILDNDVLGTAQTVQSFIVNGTTTTAGGTYNNGQISLTIAANGATTATATVDGSWTVTYSTVAASGAVSNATITITATTPYEYYEGGY